MKTTKQTIEVDVPEGFKITDFQLQIDSGTELQIDKRFVGYNPLIRAINASARVSLEKTQPREITLVETDEKLGDDEFHVQHITLGDDFFKITSNKIWKIKETE